MNVKKIIGALAIFLFFLIEINAQTPLAGAPGGYSRLGADAFSLAVGNATIASSDNFGSGFSSPAMPAFTRNDFFQATTFMTGLDRHIYSVYGQHKAGAVAAVSYGLLFSKIDNIDGRNNNGEHTEFYQTNESTGLINFSLKPRKMNFTVGVSLKWHYANFFKDIPSTSSWGLDFGIVYPLMDNRLLLALAYQDVNSAYQWDTKNIYGDDGNSKTDRFPKRLRFGASYLIEDYNLTVLSETEYWSYKAESRSYRTSGSNFPTTEIVTGEPQTFDGNYFRIGSIWKPYESFNFKAGVDKIDLTYPDNKPAYSFGFRYIDTYMNFKPAFDFTYVIEPRGPQNTWILSAGFQLL